MNWLAASLLLSLVLTVALNLALRLFPRAAERSADALTRAAHPRDGQPERRVRVFVPWKAMLIASVVGTILLNVLLR